jgi:hypothetical protein
MNAPIIENQPTFKSNSNRYRTPFLMYDLLHFYLLEFQL